MTRLLTAADALPAGTLELPNTENVLSAAAAVAAAPAIALHFPKWTDGRAYSQAVLLRSRLGYRGPLIATGDVVVDMLPLLRRCGFDTARLREGQSLDTARRLAETLPAPFPAHYQGDAVGSAPVFARAAV